MSNWTPFPSQSLTLTQASNVVHEQNNSHVSSLVDTREASAHEPDVEHLRTGQPRNVGWTRLDTKSSSPEVHTTPNDKAGSSGWYASIPKESDFEYPIGENDAWMSAVLAGTPTLSWPSNLPHRQDFSTLIESLRDIWYVHSVLRVMKTATPCCDLAFVDRHAFAWKTMEDILRRYSIPLALNHREVSGSRKVFRFLHRRCI